MPRPGASLHFLCLPLMSAPGRRSALEHLQQRTRTLRICENLKGSEESCELPFFGTTSVMKKTPVTAHMMLPIVGSRRLFPCCYARANLLNTSLSTLLASVEARPAPNKLAVSSTAGSPDCASFVILLPRQFRETCRNSLLQWLLLCAKLWRNRPLPDQVTQLSALCRQDISDTKGSRESLEKSQKQKNCIEWRNRLSLSEAFRGGFVVKTRTQPE